jgi:hypothetical protein
VNLAPVSIKAVTIAVLEGFEGFPISTFTIGPLLSRSSAVIVTIKGKSSSELALDQYRK